MAHPARRRRRGLRESTLGAIWRTGVTGRQSDPNRSPHGQSPKAAQTMNPPNHFACFQTFIISTIAAPVLIYPPSLEAKDIIMDKSPDGNFALRIQLPKEAGDEPKVGMINLPTEEAVLELDCHRCYEGNAKPRLVWFSDSQRVAYYTQHPHGGYTQVYFRRGSSFEQVQLPNI